MTFIKMFRAGNSIFVLGQGIPKDLPWLTEYRSFKDREIAELHFQQDYIVEIIKRDMTPIIELN